MRGAVLALAMRRSAPKLSEAARHVVMPSGIETTAWPSVDAECRRLGIVFDPWQDGAGRIVFAKRADGTYAASIGGIVMSIPRQVGKTFFLGAIIFALCMLHPGLLVIWTAHQLPTAGETHRAMAAMSRQPKIARFIKQVRLGSGDEAVEFVNGSRILFGARERGFGLGFTKVGVLVLDEAQRLTSKTLDDLVPTMNQAENPLMFFIGTPPRPTDQGEEFKRRRREALSGESDDMVYIELSADPDVQVAKWETGKVDWSAVERANPSFPFRTPKSAILRMRKQLTSESFQREGLGIWDADAEGSREITVDEWSATAVDHVTAEGIRALGVAFSLDGSRVSVAGALKHAGGQHVELIDAHDSLTADGIGPLADWIAARWRSLAWIVISGKAGADALELALRERGVSRMAIHVATSMEYYAACSQLPDAVRGHAVTHPIAPEGDLLDASVAISDKKQRTANGAWGWIATTPGGDETPVEAVSLALWGVRTTKRRPGRKQRRI